MSTSMNENAAAAASGGDAPEFGSHVAPTGPETTKGHQPGRLVGNDAVPEHNIEVLPPGTAPASRSFQPNNISEVPGQSMDNYAATQDDPSGVTKASETLMGATSADVHTGLGHPGAGQSSAEVRHDGASHRDREQGGLQKVGASGAEHGLTKESSGKRVDDI